MNNEQFSNMIDLAFNKYAPRTRRCYKDELRFFARFLKTKDLDRSDSSDALAYYAQITKSVSCHDGQPLASKTIKRKMLSLYSIFEDANILDLVGINPFEKVAKIARDIRVTYKREPKAIPFQQVFNFINSSKNLRNRALFAVLFGGGLRVSELVELKRDDITIIKGSIGLDVKTLKVKTEKHRPVMLPEWASKIVSEYLRSHKSEWLFPNNLSPEKPITRKRVSDICHDVFNCRAHTARHTHISYLLSIGIPVADVARSVGHESIQSTLIYDRRILKFESSCSSRADFEKNIL